jgi:hypothetical protein
LLTPFPEDGFPRPNGDLFLSGPAYPAFALDDQEQLGSSPAVFSDSSLRIQVNAAHLCGSRGEKDPGQRDPGVSKLLYGGADFSVKTIDVHGPSSFMETCQPIRGPTGGKVTLLKGKFTISAMIRLRFATNWNIWR